MVKMTLQQMTQLISEFFRGAIEEQEGEVYHWLLQERGVAPDKGVRLEVKEDTLRAILHKLSLYNEKDSVILYNDRSFEILVQEENSSRFSIIRREKIKIEDSINGLVYMLSKPSDEYLIYLLFNLSKISSIKEIVGPFWWKYVLSRYRKSFLEEDEEFNNDVLFLLSHAVPRSLTLQITSEKSRSVGEFEKLASAFLFQLSYNLDVAVVPQRSLDKLAHRGRITRLRRSRLKDIEAPKRIYVPDLIYYYQMAIAAESPSLEYLSYYHIAEYFFESIFRDDLIERVRQRITEPNFSYKRKKDVKKLIDEISRSLQIKNDRTVFSEEEALRLTLKRFLDIEELLSSLRKYDEHLVDYFKGHRVSFSSGNEIDLEHGERDKILRSIAKRIYKTRNAIVHSKESEQSRYIPFSHDQELAQEVVLLRFVAEQIIIHSSEIL